VSSRADDKRVWLFGGAVLAVLIALAGWLMVISPKLSATQSLRDEETSARAQNAVLESKVAKLAQQNDKVGELTASLRTALDALPFDSGLPDFTRQLSAKATAKRVTLNSITVGAAAPVAGAAAAGTTVNSSGTPSTTTTAVAIAPVAIPVTLASTGLGADLLGFLKAIQVDGPRRALVNSTTLGTGAGAGPGDGTIDGWSTMTIQLTVFSAPLTAAAQAQLEKLLTGK
jgi:hypothetical protein